MTDKEWKELCDWAETKNLRLLMLVVGQVFISI